MIATSYQLMAISGSAVVTSLAPLPPSEGLTVERQLQTNSNTPVAASRWRSGRTKVFLSTGHYRDKKLSYRRETARQLHTSFSARSLIVHFTEHRTCFTTI